MATRRRSVRRNPADPLDLLLLGGIGLGGLLLVQKLQEHGGDLGAALGSLIPHIGPGPNNGDPNNPCFQTRVGNTHITFNVTPTAPARVEGAEVVYSGQLNANINFLQGNYSPIAGGEIQFYDLRDCSQPFARVSTDAQGRYSFTSRLASWDLDGYKVFAYFPGAQGFALGINAEPAQSGIITVTPQ